MHSPVKQLAGIVCRLYRDAIEFGTMQHFRGSYSQMKILTHRVSKLNKMPQSPDTGKITALRLIAMLTCCLTIGACSISGTNLLSRQSPDNLRMTGVSPIDIAIISDHIHVIEQIFAPLKTTLQITNSDTDSRLTTYAILLAKNGYGIQRVTADQGVNYLSYNRATQVGKSPALITFTTQIGTVDISRDYIESSTGTISPASPFRLSGTRTEVTVDSVEIANLQVSDPAYSTTSYTASLGLDEQVPVISLVTPELVDRIAADTSGSSGLPPADPRAPSLQALNSNRIEINNLFYTDTSTFSSLLADYTRVDRQVIIFGNDSMILGNPNKELINQFVDSKVRDSDLVTLVGCSNGWTDLEIGNKGLALGRAKRVSEALLARGIARDRILDEGCWAPVSAGDKFPARGVVMDLWRKTS
jgi:hypothetical protein